MRILQNAGDWKAKLKRHQVALWALIFTVGGCNLPLAEISIQGSVYIEKALYNGYLIASIWLLWRLCRREQPSCWAAMDALLLTYSIVPIMQFTLHLPRPNTSPIEILNGFPSGHAVALFSLAWLMHLAHQKWGLLWFFFATIIALSRVVSDYHYGYQVAAGAIIGLLLGWWLSGREIENLLSYRLWRWLKAKYAKRAKAPDKVGFTPKINP